MECFNLNDKSLFQLIYSVLIYVGSINEKSELEFSQSKLELLVCYSSWDIADFEILYLIRQLLK